MTPRHLALVCSVSALTLLTACSSRPARTESIGDARGVSIPAAQYGNVSSIQVVPIAARTSGGGAVLGAVLGGVIGHQIGGGSGRTAATGLGAIGGALVGDNIESRNKADSEIFRVSVRLDNGSIGQYDYQRIDDLRVGDRVRLEAGQLYRV